MSLSQGIFYDDANNFIFDSDKIEIVGGKAQLKDLLVGATFYANYNTDINGTFGNGSLAFTAHGGASVSGGQLDLRGGTLKYIEGSAVANADSAETGCFRFQYTPNYTGDPATVQLFFSVLKAHNNNNNQITVFQRINGQICLMAYNNNSNLIVNYELGSINFIAGQQYEFELNFDFTAGATRLFIDGVQFGITMPETLFREHTDIGLLRIGTNSNATLSSNFSIDNFVVFDTVQHTADYTPDCGTPYCTGGVPIMVNSAIECDDIEELADLVFEKNDGKVRFSFDVNGTGRYWDGGAWADSDGTYSQANDFTDLTPAVLAELLTTASRVKLIAFLYSSDGSTTPSITSILVYYDFGVVDIPTVNKCIVWGFIAEGDGTKKDLIVYAKLDSKRVYDFDGEVLITRKVVSTLTNDEGYFELELPDNANMPAGAYYDFWLDGIQYKKIVPNEPTKEFWELVNV